MMRFLGSPECQALLDLVLSEAESDTGTWSLATYVKVRNVVPRFPSTDMALFVKRVVDLSISPTSKSSTRYKLAQIMSAIHGLCVPEFEHAMRDYHSAIEESCEEIGQSGELGKPTVKLLKALAADPSRRATGGTDLHLRRVSATPVFAPADVICHSRVSRSPGPGLLPSPSLV
jgi:hypothetical protein